MIAVVRTTLSIILLLHSFFGCSVLHACGCHPHEHDFSTKSDVAVHGDDPVQEDPSVQHGPSVAAEIAIPEISGEKITCSCHKHHTNLRPANQSSDSLVTIMGEISTDCGCQSHPCDGKSPNCHSALGCSFLHTTDDLFSVEPIFVGFVSYACFITPGRSVASMAWQNAPGRAAPLGCLGSLDHCATLSTWQI